MFYPHRVPLSEARIGDILTFQRDNKLADILSWLIKKVKEPKWSRWEWHMAAVVAPDIYADAMLPRIRLSKISQTSLEMHCYRIVENPPEQTTIDEFIKDHIGKPYDFLVYLWTGLWALGIPVPRIIDWSYSCWEIAYDMCEYIGIDIDKSDRRYPFITDFLRYVGELE